METSVRPKESKKKNRVTDIIIEKIRENILSGRTKPGDKLANEKEMMGEFGVSKATMREALRVLEAMGLLEIKKGIGGGAFVSEVDMRTTIHSVINFCNFRSVSVKDITILRYFIEPQVAQIAAVKRTETDIENLQKNIRETYQAEVEKEIGFHCYLVRITKNPLLILIVDFIDNILRSIKSKLHLNKTFFDLVEYHHKLILECLIQQDSQAAGVVMANDILGTGKFLAELSASEPFDPDELQQFIKSEDRMLAMMFQQQVVSNKHPINTQPGVMVRKIGSSDLNLVSYKAEGKSAITDIFNWEHKTE
jgi:GntR family transcriptional repressor for pyruvate dehydrogenase complex